MLRGAELGIERVGLCSCCWVASRSLTTHILDGLGLVGLVLTYQLTNGLILMERWKQRTKFGLEPFLQTLHSLHDKCSVMCIAHDQFNTNLTPLRLKLYFLSPSLVPNRNHQSTAHFDSPSSLRLPTQPSKQVHHTRHHE